MLATNGNTRLGGDDLDRRIVDFLRGEDPSGRRTGLRIGNRQSAIGKSSDCSPASAKPPKQAKISLSTETEVEIALPFLTPEFSFSYKLTRARTGTPDARHHRAHAPALPAFAGRREARGEGPRSGHSGRRPDAHAAGAPARGGVVRLRGVRGDARRHPTRRGIITSAQGPQLNTSQNPDEAVALGAAIQAEILSGGFTQRAVAGRHAALARARNVRRLDERDHPAQLDDSGQGRRDVHDRRGSISAHAHPRAAGRTRARDGQLEPRHDSPWSSSRRRAACRAWACSSRSTPTAFCTCWPATREPAARKSWR